MTGIIFGIFCLISIPILIGYGIGWAMRGRRGDLGTPGGTGRGVRSVRTSDQLAVETRDHAKWLTAELERQPFTDILTPQQRIDLKVHYTFEVFSAKARSPQTMASEPAGATAAAPKDMPTHDQREGEPLSPFKTIMPASDTPTSDPPDVSTPPQSFPPLDLTPIVTAPEPVSGSTVSEQRHSPMTLWEEPDQPSPKTSEETPSLTRSRRSPIEWDPAVLLLYLGAFLVVAAGIVYSSYNWSHLGSVQKIGMLALVTVAFAGGGLVLLRIPRVRQAAETFVAIGALLVPSNAIAVYTVSTRTDASLGVTMLIGSLATAIIYGIFSYRPGGWVYCYGTVISSFLALAAIPAAIQIDPAWGAILVILAIAMTPDLDVRLQQRGQRFRRPLRHVGLVALPLATLIAIGGIESGTIWLLPIAFATATVALARLALLHDSPLLTGTGTITALGAIAGVLIALDSSTVIWALVSIVVGFAWILVGEYGPTLIRRADLRLLIHIEVLGLLLSGVGFSLAAERDWLLSLTLIAVVAGASIVAWLRRNRWLLLLAGSAGIATYLSILLYTPDFSGSDTKITLFLAPIPILLSLVAGGCDRWTRRRLPASRSWGEPLWILAAISATVVTGFPGLERENRLIALRIVLSIVFALISLAAAASLRIPLIRVAYGAWMLVALSNLVWLSPGTHQDQLALSLVGIAAISLPSLPGVTRHLGTRSSSISDRIAARKPWELAIFAVAGGATLLSMLGSTLAWISDAQSFSDGIPAVRWTWIAYLTIYATIAIGSATIGYWRRVEKKTLGLPETAFGFGIVATAVLTRMFSTDPLVWTWVGLVTAGAAIGVAVVAQRQNAAVTTPFSRRCVQLGLVGGLTLGAISVIVNLGLRVLDDRQTNDWVQATVYLAIGGTIFLTSLITARPRLTYGALLAFAIAIAFANAAAGGSTFTLGIAAIGGAWVLMGASMAMHESGIWRRQRQIWSQSAFTLPVVAIMLGLTDSSLTPSGREWHLLSFAILTLGGLIAIDAWRRQDARQGLIASAIAMIGVLFEIAATEPANIQAYTIPIALYLLALGWSQRSRGSQRDMLLGAGAAILISPTFFQALAGDGFGWILLAGGEALAFFFIGIVLRLRILIAAGIVAITLIVLRMVIDTVNAMPSWMILLVVGVVLLAGGTVMVAWKDEVRARLDRLHNGWNAMD